MKVGFDKSMVLSALRYKTLQLFLRLSSRLGWGQSPEEAKRSAERDQLLAISIGLGIVLLLGYTVYLWLKGFEGSIILYIIIFSLPVTAIIVIFVNSVRIVEFAGDNSTFITEENLYCYDFIDTRKPVFFAFIGLTPRKARWFVLPEDWYKDLQDALQNSLVLTITLSPKLRYIQSIKVQETMLDR